ncbi:MAG: S-layer homology domain-containing protein, partial [Candidatus Gracilibacteria bacterium]|nr:S-layer homology domain-containing protein [Candidatus Gracilibacteria bacterium]
IANGVVVRVKDVETGDGKYVVVRHDDIEVDGQKETLYSAYEHLSEIIAVEGTKIKRGEVLGKVGMTGITTTPHLHFQIDKASAPFHAYWPFTFREAGDLGLDFFGAINVGLGKENTIRYTIHPMEFIKNHRFLGSAPEEKTLSIAADVSATQSTAVTASTQLVADASNATPVVKTEPVVNSASRETIEQAPTFTPTASQPFSDIAKNSPFYTATKYLADAGITKGYADHGFHPNDLISRSETILLYARIFKLQPLDSAVWEFNDILPSDEVAPYLARALENKIIARANTFRPNDSLTRAEAITLLIRSAKLPLDTIKRTAFQDVKLSHTHRTYINTFATYLNIRGTNFSPDTSITRGELAKILFVFDQKQKRK